MTRKEYNLDSNTNGLRVVVENESEQMNTLIVIIHSGSMNKLDSTDSKEVLLYDQLNINAKQNSNGIVRFDTVSASLENIDKEIALNENLSRTIKVLNWINKNYPKTPIILHGMSAGTRTILKLPKILLTRNIKSIILLSCFIVSKVDLTGVKNIHLLYGAKDCVIIQDKDSKDQTKILFPKQYVSFCFRNLETENQSKFAYLVDGADHFLCIGDKDYTKTIEIITEILNLKNKYENIT